jgi:hypothetical protein
MSLAYAAEVNAGIDSIVGKLRDNIFIPIVTFLFALAVIYFLYGVFEFVLGLDNEEKRKAGQKHMLWGIIGLFIMVSVGGIMSLVSSFLTNG